MTQFILLRIQATIKKCIELFKQLGAEKGDYTVGQVASYLTIFVFISGISWVGDFDILWKSTTDKLVEKKTSLLEYNPLSLCDEYKSTNQVRTIRLFPPKIWKGIKMEVYSENFPDPQVFWFANKDRIVAPGVYESGATLSQTAVPTRSDRPKCIKNIKWNSDDTLLMYIDHKCTNFIDGRWIDSSGYYMFHFNEYDFIDKMQLVAKKDEALY
ncbi:MAG: hypothetical protein D3913_05345 [Candidatus Electrothrix sp. LOE1_4_5]|nr:hypothetical protein [Candidatus Electrothrix gigas]